MKVRLAAAQPLNARTRAIARCRGNAVKRNEHFLKYNIGASTYDEAYVREYGEEYLTYLDGFVRRAADRTADLLLLPEFAFVPGVLASSGPTIPPNPRAFADAVRLYTWSARRFQEWLGGWTRKTGMYGAAALLTARGGRLHNTGIVMDPKGRLAGRYDKIHMPEDELVHFSPGRDSTIIPTPLGRVAFSICYDVQFPEHHACLALRGAQIVLHPSGGYTLPDETWDMGRNRLRVRASDHYCALVYSCFAPSGPWMPAESCVIAPNGRVVAEVRGEKAGMAIGDVEIGAKRSWPGDGEKAPDREQIRRRLRRPDTYAPLSSRRRK